MLASGRAAGVAGASHQTGVKFKSRLASRSALSGVCHCHSVNSSALPSMTRQKLGRLLGSDVPVLLLERSPGARLGADADLWQALPFDGQIFPDLPLASSWSGLLRAMLTSFDGAADPPTVKPLAAQAPVQPPVNMEQRCTVRTVAAQARSQRAIEEQLLRAVDPAHATAEFPAADALLCLSGSHPARRLLGSDRFLQSSFDVLRTARRLRGKGLLPADTGIWAVENPLTNHPSRFEDKVESGAEVIVTQPPLVWAEFEAWFDKVHRQGLTKETRLVVGLPMLTSPGNLSFWATLCNAWGVDGMNAVMMEFKEAEAAGKPQLQHFCRTWNADLLRKVQQLPDVRGLHVMPLTKAARSLAAELLS